MSLVCRKDSWYLTCNGCGKHASNTGYRRRADLERHVKHLGWNERRALCSTCKARKKTSVKKHFDKPPLLAGQVEG